MPAMLAFIIVAVAVIAITYKTYVGYGDYRWYAKTAFLLFLILGWCAPFIGFALRYNDPSGSLIWVTKALYFLFGFVFFLFVVSFVRDTLWMVLDLIRRAPMEEMKNPPLLQKVNLITVIFCLLLCCYGVYEAEKDAAVKNYDIVSAKMKKPTKLVMLSDLHIDVDVSAEYVKNLVNRVNDLNPDVIVLVGDIIDNSPRNLYKQMAELKGLKAKDGVFVTLGNHEFYSGAQTWAITFSQMGFDFLNSYGKKIDDTGLYIAGIPDINAAKGVGMPIKIDNALNAASKGDYVVMLSHAPLIAEGVTSENVDLQLSGHTHGGQIYPFHYFTKQANNGVLAGFYNQNGIKLYVSRGTRYWGPPMRILAPSEIAVFNFTPAKPDVQPAQ